MAWRGQEKSQTYYGSQCFVYLRLNNVDYLAFNKNVHYYYLSSLEMICYDDVSIDIFSG